MRLGWIAAALQLATSARQSRIVDCACALHFGLAAMWKTMLVFSVTCFKLSPLSPSSTNEGQEMQINRD